MYTLSYLTAFILVICANQLDGYFTLGKCIASPAIKDFQIQKYAGKWYNIERAGILYEYAVQCATATYECADGCKKLRILNAGVTSIGDFKFNRTGMATGRPDAPSSLDVDFDNGSKVVYNVWETDYESYALVYACEKWANMGLLAFKLENAWILSRNKTLDGSVIKGLKATLDAKGAKSSKLTSVDQSCTE